jgi:hypothetical protein
MAPLLHPAGPSAARTAAPPPRAADRRPDLGRRGPGLLQHDDDKIRLCTATGSPGTWVDVLLGHRPIIDSADIADGTIVNGDIDIAPRDLAGDRALQARDRPARACQPHRHAARRDDLQLRHAGQHQPPRSDGGADRAGGDGRAEDHRPRRRHGRHGRRHQAAARRGRRRARRQGVRARRLHRQRHRRRAGRRDRRRRPRRLRPVLLKNQTTGSENGIYVWNGAAVP